MAQAALAGHRGMIEATWSHKIAMLIRFSEFQVITYFRKCS
jgi:hypothetical protein